MNSLVQVLHLQVQSASALSGTLAWGFPNLTAIHGLVHAWQRRLHQQGFDLFFKAWAIVIHDHQVQISRSHFNQHFHLARFPYHAGWKKFKNEAGPIIEEPKMHLEISLLIEMEHDDYDLLEDQQSSLNEAMMNSLMSLRLAGGRINALAKIDFDRLGESQQERDQYFQKIKYRLLPGFALVERSSLLQAHAQQKGLNATDALLDILAWHHRGDEVERLYPGWLVPISIGYAPLTALQQNLSGQRDIQYPFRFVENIYTLGEWLSPHRCNSIDALLWHSATDEYRLYNLYEEKNG